MEGLHGDGGVVAVVATAHSHRVAWCAPGLWTDHRGPVDDLSPGSGGALRR
jgi:hypothetical protein